MNEWTNDRTSKWMNEQMNEWGLTDEIQRVIGIEPGAMDKIPHACIKNVGDQ